MRSNSEWQRKQLSNTSWDLNRKRRQEIEIRGTENKSRDLKRFQTKDKRKGDQIAWKKKYPGRISILISKGISLSSSTPRRSTIYGWVKMKWVRSGAWDSSLPSFHTFSGDLNPTRADLQLLLSSLRPFGKERISGRRSCRTTRIFVCKWPLYKLGLPSRPEFFQRNHKFTNIPVYKNRLQSKYLGICGPNRLLRS